MGHYSKDVGRIFLAYVYDMFIIVIVNAQLKQIKDSSTRNARRFR